MEKFEKIPESNLPQFEKVEKIILEETKDDDFDIEISIFEEMSQEEIEKKLREQLTAQNWWLVDIGRKKDFQKSKLIFK